MSNTSSLLLAVTSLLISTSVSLAAAPIVGGSRVPPGAWPDAVAVIAWEGTCTGTLIAPDVVLTAGHCAVLEPHEVIVNTIDFGRPGGETIRVKTSRVYPEWQTMYDVGVLVLERPARTAPRAVARACGGQTITAAGQVRLVGFGLTETTGTGNNTALHEALVTIDDPWCTEAPGCNPEVAPEGEFTAGGRGTDSCFGDSGGPVYVTTASGAAVIGVVSRGMDVPGRPCGNGGIYVRADKVVPWIESVTGRQIERSTCEAPTDAPAPADEPASGGCMAGGGALELGLVTLVSGLVWRRRRRRA